jgi:hypothetical protein
MAKHCHTSSRLRLRAMGRRKERASGTPLQQPINSPLFALSAARLRVTNDLEMESDRTSFAMETILYK